MNSATASFPDIGSDIPANRVQQSASNRVGVWRSAPTPRTASVLGLAAVGFFFVPCFSYADGPPSRPPSGRNEKLSIPFDRKQNETLARLDPSCAAQLAGDPAQSSNIAAYDLSSSGLPMCLLSN